MHRTKRVGCHRTVGLRFVCQRGRAAGRPTCADWRATWRYLHFALQGQIKGMLVVMIGKEVQHG
jgi:hypothetical protein